MSTSPITNPKVAAELGEKIYRDRYKDTYEREYPGKFVAINVLTETPYIADTPEDALDHAYKSATGGVFHLIQVGHVGAFRVSHSNPSSASMDWVFR